MDSPSYGHYEQMDKAEEQAYRNEQFNKAFRVVTGQNPASDTQRFEWAINSLNIGLNGINYQLKQTLGKMDIEHPAVDTVSNEPAEFDPDAVEGALDDVADFLANYPANEANRPLENARERLEEARKYHEKLGF
jgi:hypothetical protein